MSSVPVPPDQPPHEARDVAESFGRDPARYDRSRPRYPEAMIERIVAASPGPQFLDVGIGTGIVARHFQADGCRILGIEVDPRMAEWTRGQGLDVEVGKFEEWDPAGRDFDAVVAGQAWHWVDPVAGAAKAGQVLRPQGRIAVFWNADQLPPELGAAFAEVYARVLPGSLAARRYSAQSDNFAGIAARAAEGIRAAGVFGEPERWEYDWERVYARDEILDQIPTTGGHTSLSEEKLDELLGALGAAIDAAGGEFTMTYRTVAVTAAIERS